MKKTICVSLILFFIAVILTAIHRIFDSQVVIKPFILNEYKSIEISVAWYIKFICEHLSEAFLMLSICAILKPIEKHLLNSEWPKHNAMYVFVKLWHRIFSVVALCSILDTINFILSFKRADYYFIIQNTIFVLLTSYYLLKAYKK